MTLPELVIGFMSYYAMYDFNEWHIDVRRKELRNRNEVTTVGYQNEGVRLSIECPVNGKCPTRNVTKECYKAFRKAINHFNSLIWKQVAKEKEKDEFFDAIVNMLGINKKL
ncbi:unnamed protein product [Bursaphelenchus okinawaensis]|uniref:PAP-associated domain-containing protein n=1 Tax=Bursaphelenchus okinawaensis TaxID=465554 RepID=A0A811JRJ3_9BILA|nr:unnamed protein product [Bursaphelenchus okinawaensis]CAG9080276.1 unnamed protein product [Bursaphelenchus okinawaensis]